MNMVRGRVAVVGRQYITVGRYVRRVASGRARRVGETFTVGSLVDDVKVATILAKGNETS